LRRGFEDFEAVEAKTSEIVEDDDDDKTSNIRDIYRSIEQEGVYLYSV